MSQTIVAPDTESAMTMIEWRARMASTVVQDLIEDYFMRTDGKENMKRIAYEYERMKVYVEIVENLLGQIAKECAELEELRERAVSGEGCSEKRKVGLNVNKGNLPLSGLCDNGTGADVYCGS